MRRSRYRLGGENVTARQSDTPTAVGSDILHFLLLSDSEKLAQNRNGKLCYYMYVHQAAGGERVS